MAATGREEPTTEATLAWESDHRRLAGFAALGAAVLTLLGNILISVALRDLPKADNKIVTVTDALRDAVDGRPIPPGRLSVQAEFLGHHAAAPIAGAILVGLGTLLLFVPLAYLFRAARARRAGVGQWLLVLLAIGAVFYGLGNIMTGLARDLGAQDFLNAHDKSNSAAASALTQSPYLPGQILAQFGAFALGFGLVLTSLHAMRTGLLTRFMGILGMIVGVTVVLPLDQLGIIRSFWLAALAALILGRWPQGTPAAWTRGEAVPWPSQQELREQRQKAAGKGGGALSRGRSRADAKAAPKRQGTAAPEPQAPVAPRPQPRGGEAHSASKKKRRKRRS